MKQAQKVFTIDGSYFFHRALGTLNRKDAVNHLITDAEQKEFTNCCVTSLLNVWESMSKHFNNLIFVTDKNSWRKDIVAVKPYYIREEEARLLIEEESQLKAGFAVKIVESEPIGYKGQRKSVKEESLTDYNKFYELCDQFINDVLKPNMIVFDIAGLEGDDNIMLLSNYFKTLGQENVDILNCVFCTDGDLIQTVNKNNILFRNIRSKVAPFGEFVINVKTYESCFEATKTQQLLSSTLTGPMYYKQLFNTTLTGARANRTINEGINIAQPFKLALIKSICGDKKDNIFPLFRWIKGSKNYKVTQKMLEKALKLDTQFLTESTAISYLTDKNLLTNLLTNLRDIVKQPTADLKEVGKHLKHNLRLIVLTPKNVPDTYIAEFNRVLESYEHAILHDTFDNTFLTKINLTVQDRATDIMSESIPGLLDNPM